MFVLLGQEKIIAQVCESQTLQQARKGAGNKVCMCVCLLHLFYATPVTHSFNSMEHPMLVCWGEFKICYLQVHRQCSSENCMQRNSGGRVGAFNFLLVGYCYMVNICCFPLFPFIQDAGNNSRRKHTTFNSTMQSVPSLTDQFN